jgi:hypothetical protein
MPAAPEIGFHAAPKFCLPRGKNENSKKTPPVDKRPGAR